MKIHIASETVKSAPAIIGASISAVTLNGAVAVLTIVYVLCQLAYLAWKWRKEASA